jgi:hypothetical protein
LPSFQLELELASRTSSSSITDVLRFISHHTQFQKKCTYTHKSAISHKAKLLQDVCGYGEIIRKVRTYRAAVADIKVATFLVCTLSIVALAFIWIDSVATVA